MKKNIIIMIRKVSLLSVFFFLINCKKKENLIGAELQNNKAEVNVFDNFAIKSYTVKQDSLRVSGVTISPLGSYLDPVFGKTSTGFYSHLRLSSNNVNFAPQGSPQDIQIDSVVLSLTLAGHYGNLTPQTFEVFELTEDINPDSIYYSNRSFSVNMTNIALTPDNVITPNPNQKIFVEGDSVEPQLRVKLQNSFAQKIIDESGNTTLVDNTNFLQFIKGIYVTTNNSQSVNDGAILLANLLHENSKVTIYYRDTVQKDTTSFDLLINDECARVNKVAHDYTGTSVQNQLNDSTLGLNETYIQGLIGLKTKVEFTDIEKIKDSGYTINKAILSLPINYTSGNVFKPNPQLLVVRNQDGEDLLTPDQSLFGLSYLGGIWEEGKTTYEFNITRYINNVVTGNYPNNPISIETASNLITPNRAILYGVNGTEKPKLTITYTK